MYDVYCMCHRAWENGLICKIHFIDGCTVLAIDGQICFWATITPSNVKLPIGQAALYETTSSGSVV